MVTIRVPDSPFGGTEKQLPSQTHNNHAGPAEFGKLGLGHSALVEELHLYSLGRQDVLAASTLCHARAAIQSDTTAVLALPNAGATSDGCQ